MNKPASPNHYKELEEILDRHLNGIKAGHDNKLKEEIITLLHSAETAARINEVEKALEAEEDLSVYISESPDDYISGDKLRTRLAALQEGQKS